METPLRYLRRACLPTVAMALLCSVLGACSTSPRPYTGLDLEPRQSAFSHGRVTVVLLDEYGIAMPGMRVDLSWQEPSFYKTSAFTNRQGEVTFSGVPELAEVSVNHPGGYFTGALLVPQSGRPEYRVMLDTLGGGEMMRQQERARLAPRGTRQSGGN